MDDAVKRFERIHEKTFNPNSTMQLREVFFNILKLRSTKKPATGAQSTDKEVLAELEDRIVDLETIDAIIENEMRTIMSDHSNFNDVLKDMGKSGYGDNRQYGSYSD